MRSIVSRLRPPSPRSSLASTVVCLFESPSDFSSASSSKSSSISAPSFNLSHKLNPPNPPNPQSSDSTDPESAPLIDDVAPKRSEKTALSVYHRNLERRYSLLDPASAARMMKSWPMITTNVKTLVDDDIPQGIKFNVAYHDTHAFDRHLGPIVVILHGFQPPTPSFRSFIEPLLLGGCRIIAPIFPYYGHMFWRMGPGQATISKDMNLVSHSTMERTIFAQDFIKTVLPKEIKADVLICCDIGTYPGAWLAAYGDCVRSVVFIDPLPPKPVKSMYPMPLMTWLSRTWEIPFFRPLTMPFMPYLMHTYGSRTVKEASAHFRQIAFSNFDVVDSALFTMYTTKFPRLAFSSNSCKWVTCEETEDFMSLAGLEDMADLEDDAHHLVDIDFEHGYGRRYWPIDEEDPMARYNRRYAKADFSQFGKQISQHVHRLIKHVNKRKL